MVTACVVLFMDNVVLTRITPAHIMATFVADSESNVSMKKDLPLPNASRLINTNLVHSNLVHSRRRTLKADVLYPHRRKVLMQRISATKVAFRKYGLHKIIMTSQVANG
jgi:hypothetical protein